MSKYSVDNFMSNLPDPILKDEHLRQFAEVAARVMLKNWQKRRAAAIYCRIDELDEGVLDILAKDLKVDWYDYEASIDVKRRLIKDNWYVHKRIGTKAAVERALSDIWPESSVTEWFEYGGDPYHFKVTLDISANAGVDLDEVRKRIKLFQNARSILEELVFAADEDVVTLLTDAEPCGYGIRINCIMY